LHWQQQAKSATKDTVLPEFEKPPLGEDESNFAIYSPGPIGVFAVFEDSDKTGWFYLYDARQRNIVKCAHIYNHANVAVKEDEVDIGWAVDGSVCGLAIWGEFRAFLGVSKELELRKPLQDAEERGIPASDWPAGFDRYLEKKMD
jgi:Uncharacterized protein conserved in bacteria (DUF2251)